MNMSWRLNIVRGLGLDPPHHKELWNCPEIKRTYMVCYLGFWEKSFVFFRYRIKNILEGSRRGPTWPMGSCGYPFMIRSNRDHIKIESRSNRDKIEIPKIKEGKLRRGSFSPFGRPSPYIR
jgi:hypothetical protein